jgi:hypothetical protein
MRQRILLVKWISARELGAGFRHPVMRLSWHSMP